MHLRFLTPAHFVWIKLMVCLFLACIFVGHLDAQAAEHRYLWQSRDQFVALESQDQGTNGPALPNEHPTEVALERLTAILDSIDLHTADSDKPVPLYTKETIEVLAPLLQKGLHQASPGEDVTFAVIGLHKGIFGFAKSPKVTTGRVYYQGGRLNIIVGLAQQDVNEREDRRLSPFTPGSRVKIAAGEWALIPHAGQDAFIQVRKDWVAFDDKWQSPTLPVPTVEKKSDPVSEQAAPPSPEMQKNHAPSPAERLTTLNDLKAKGLITEEEYRTKRLEILNGL